MNRLILQLPANAGAAFASSSPGAPLVGLDAKLFSELTDKEKQDMTAKGLQRKTPGMTENSALFCVRPESSLPKAGGRGDRSGGKYPHHRELRHNQGRHVFYRG
jgi:hypothetical protein